eukprot:Em0048g12a
MTTRSGRTYKSATENPTMTEESVAALMRILLEDRKAREEQYEAQQAQMREQMQRQRERDELEQAQRREQMERQRERDELEKNQMREQMEMLRRVVEESRRPEEPRMRPTEGEAKLVKLTEQDDIESYLTTFERIMRAYEVKDERWAVKIAPQLTGKAQQAYAAMKAEDAGNYQLVKEAILRRYDISEQTYRQRFRDAVMKKDETVGELNVRLTDLFLKWTKGCKTVEQLRDLMILEQLVNTLQTEERKFNQKATVDGKKKTASETVPRQGSEPKGDSATQMAVGKRSSKREIRCFNCKETGHMARDCPSNALFGEEQGMLGIKHSGVVEGKAVEDIMLDTGCSRTMVRGDLVPGERLLEGRCAVVRCAHGDTVVYPMAQICLEVDGHKINTAAAVSNTLPMAVLLGTDVPELLTLLNCRTLRGKVETSEAFATTRAASRRRVEEEREQARREKSSGVQPKPVPAEQPKESWDLGAELDEAIFQGGRQRPTQTRSQRRQKRQEHSRRVCPQLPADTGLNLSASELQKLQETDPTLSVLRKVSGREVDSGGGGSDVSVVVKDGLMYRVKARTGELPGREQLVLPNQCRRVVIELAHSIPLAGHMGRNKTIGRILQRFYWPTVYKDVAEFCKRCETCQKSSKWKPKRAPLVPLPILDEPFRRIAMDIVGPLPRSRSGNRYVLVICDYATRFPEAVPMRSIDAENVAEELLKLFARVGIPVEILTDQGANFTSQLLSELYSMLHIHGIRTTPYHPQTDGLVERFNQTLKAMLRKTAVQEGKDWDLLIPYVLFAYREVPQSSTGFSPFELLYGREVRGPLDVVKETWEASERSNQSVVSYVVNIREKLEKMMAWYGRTWKKLKRYRRPGTTSTLDRGSSRRETVSWFYYQLRTTHYWHNGKGHIKWVFHVNMLREFYPDNHQQVVGWAEDMETDLQEEIPVWKDGEAVTLDSCHMGEQLTPEQKTELCTLLKEVSGVMSNIPGVTRMAEHCIETGNARPVKLPPYRIPQAYRETIQLEVKEMLEAGIIEPSTSDWCAPIVPVKKKDGTLRLCVDYRRLNAVSESDAYPMPRVDDLIDRLGGVSYITTMDLTRGYWQVPVSPDDKHKTAFAAPSGLFQFTRMPFGLKGAPATFQRLVDRVLQGLEEFSGAYIDDIIVFSKLWTDHIRHLQVVLGRLQLAGLTVKISKCHFGVTACSYLGFVVGGGLVKPEPSKVQAVLNFPTPTDKTGVRAFLGLTGYYRRFIPDFASLAAPLTDLTRKCAPTRVSWSNECEQAFTSLKGCLCSDPVLRSPNFEKQFILQTDASNRGIGAVLSQCDEEGQEHPVAYYSRKLLPREERYSTVEKECLAIKQAIHHFRMYLLGRQFKVETDHQALVWMDRLKDTNARLTRWSLLLQSYDFLVEHRKGLKNGNADGLSRGPWHQEAAANDFAAEEGGRNVRVREPDPLDRGDVISELGPPREPYGHIVVQ